jgi:hypothetical protein
LQNVNIPEVIPLSDTLQDKIRQVLKTAPHYSAARIAELVGTTQQSVRTICQRHRIFLMNRREVEDALDAALAKKGARRGKAQ